jgi:hypothetical protein
MHDRGDRRRLAVGLLGVYCSTTRRISFIKGELQESEQRVEQIRDVTEMRCTHGHFRKVGDDQYEVTELGWQRWIEADSP